MLFDMSEYFGIVVRQATEHLDFLEVRHGLSQLLGDLAQGYKVGDLRHLKGALHREFLWDINVQPTVLFALSTATVAQLEAAEVEDVADIWGAAVEVEGDSEIEFRLEAHAKASSSEICLWVSPAANCRLTTA